MYTANSIFAVSIALLLVEALLITVLYRNKNDKSARLWVLASLCLSTGFLLLLTFNQKYPFVRFFIANFLAAYATFLCIYSFQAAFGITQNKKVLDALICVAFALGIYQLVTLDLLQFVAPMAGLGFGTLNAYAYFQLKKIQSTIADHKSYLSLIALMYMGTAVLWFVRIPLANLFDLKFSVDGGLINYVLIFSIFVLLITRQVSYLILRLDMFFKLEVEAASALAESSQTQMLKSLKALSLARDNETGNHIVRTQSYVKAVALRLKEMGQYTDQLNDKTINAMFLVSPLHDIGKVGIPDSVLLKPAPLTAEEWSIMKTHTTIGETILKTTIDGEKAHTELLKIAIEISGGHHEKWNGGGYPRGLSAQQIPLSARIMSIADMYDALVSERVYKKKWSHEQAILEIKRQSGEYFDPVIVDAFVSIQDTVQSIALNYADDEDADHASGGLTAMDSITRKISEIH
jgi:HD-GYP domain-containing protein (c-di-GMP phosphodiesterase class II)